MSISSNRDLVIWQAAMDLAVDCYNMTGAFPVSERYGITSQIRRAATSVPANAAEGHGREQTGSFIQYLRIAQGSLKELETHLMLAARLGFVERDVSDVLLNKADRFGRMIRTMIRRLQLREAG